MHSSYYRHGETKHSAAEPSRHTTTNGKWIEAAKKEG